MRKVVCGFDTERLADAPTAFSRLVFETAVHRTIVSAECSSFGRKESLFCSPMTAVIIVARDCHVKNLRDDYVTSNVMLFRAPFAVCANFSSRKII